MEENGAFGGDSVVACGIEVNLAIAQDGDRHAAPADFLVSTDILFLFSLFGKGNVPLHQINFCYNGHKFINGDLEFTLN